LISLPLRGYGNSFFPLARFYRKRLEIDNPNLKLDLPAREGLDGESEKFSPAGSLVSKR